MSRTRIIFTLILVATAAMLLGLMASTLVERRLAAPSLQSHPEATEPHHNTGEIANV